MSQTRYGKLLPSQSRFPSLALASAIRCVKSMFLLHSRTTRLLAAYALFTVALVIVPKANVPETLFDEANTPTNEMVVDNAASSRETQQPLTAFAPRISPHSRRITVRRIVLVYEGRLTDSRTVRKILCSLLC